MLQGALTLVVQYVEQSQKRKQHLIMQISKTLQARVPLQNNVRSFKEALGYGIPSLGLRPVSATIKTL